MAKIWYHYWKVIIEGTWECIMDVGSRLGKGIYQGCIIGLECTQAIALNLPGLFRGSILVT